MNFMERLVFVFVLVLLMGSFVLAADGDWDSINNGTDVVIENNASETSAVTSNNSSVAGVSNTVSISSVGAKRFYTTEFYIALGVGVVVLLVLVLFVYLFFRSPKNKF